MDGPELRHRHGFRQDEIEVLAQLPWRHHVAEIFGLEDQLGSVAGNIGHALRPPAGNRPPGNLSTTGVLPEHLAAHGIGNQVNALVWIGVDDPMRCPGIEDPALALGHVDFGICALEAYRWLGLDRHMHAHPISPVVGKIGVAGNFGMAGQAHQAAASPHGAETRQHLAQVRARIQMGRRPHGAGNRIALRIAIHGNQRQRGIAGKTLGVRTPDRFTECIDFRAQARRVKTERQLDKRDLQFHAWTTKGDAPLSPFAETTSAYV